MAYFTAQVEIPYAPAGTTTDDIYDLLNDELNNGIFNIIEESIFTRRGKHKRFTIDATCRLHNIFTHEAKLGEASRVIRYVNYKGKTARLRMWVHVIPF